MYYLKVVCKIRDKVEVAKHYDLRSGAPGMPRVKKKKKTPEEMEAQNRWRRRRKIRRLIEANFKPGDWHVVLACRKGEKLSAEEARKRIRKYRDRLKAAYRKAGWELKYIITCEVGKRGGIHWHMIVNDCHSREESSAGLIRSLWEWGRVWFTPLDSSGDYKKLAEYLLKDSDGKKQEELIEKQGYMSGRNLIRPAEQTEKIRARAWRKEPKAPKGWELVPGTLVNGINKYTGLPYQHYTIRRKGGRNAESGNLHRDHTAGIGKGRGKRNVHHADTAGRRRSARKKGGSGD